MLVLTRQTDESIMIGDDVEIVVVDITSDRVKIGIRAPREIPIYRKEVYTSIKEENIEASRVDITNISNLQDLLKKSENNT